MLAGPAWGANVRRRLLLVSNTYHGDLPVLAHCADALRDRLDGCARVGFVGWAQADLDGYTERVRPAFSALGLELLGVHTGVGPDEVDAVFVGGGNTFLLTRALHEHGWIEPLRRRVAEGMPYVGASAGSNAGCPTLCTTNDMPIVQPPSFELLGLVPFQINAHYLDPDPRSTHRGETRERRIAEYHEHNDRAVIGLREGTWLWVDGDRMELQGGAPARIFEAGLDPVEVAPGVDLSHLLRPRR